MSDARSSHVVRALATALLAAGAARANTYVVTTTANSGVGSLRKAIADANGNPGADTIAFNVAGGAPFVIAPTSALPALNGPVSIDATTQPGWAGAPLVELDGASAGATDGLAVDAASCVVAGLAIHSFASGSGVHVQKPACIVQSCWIGLDSTGHGRGCNDGLRVAADACSVLDCVVSGNVANGIWFASGTGGAVKRCKVGTDASGTAALANGVGIALDGAHATIGGSVADRNVISGNRDAGIHATQFATNALISDDFVGIDATGARPLGNGGHGIAVDGSAQADVVRNVVSGNAAAGIHVKGSFRSSVVADNFVGTDSTGSFAIGNGGDGIELWNVTGGSASGNVVSGNGAAGIVVLKIGSGTNSATVEDNFVGVDASGASALPNATDGIVVMRGATATIVRANVVSGNVGSGILVEDVGTVGSLLDRNVVGLDAAGSYAIPNRDGIALALGSTRTTVVGNVVGGNVGRGIVVTGATTAAFSIDGNLVGVDAGAASAVPNGSHGIQIVDASDCTIRGNLVAWNLDGIAIERSSPSSGLAVRDRITGNTLFENVGAGIVIGSNGAIDHLDADDGPNGLQNCPEPLFALVDASATVVSGVLRSGRSGAYDIEVFGNGANGDEARRYLGTFRVGTDRSGYVLFAGVVAPWSVGLEITLTATDANGNTSELSSTVVATWNLGQEGVVPTPPSAPIDHR